MRWSVVLVLMLLAVSVASAADPPLQALALTHVGPGQGVYAEAEDGSVLVSEAAAKPVHPASVSKVATSLALLDRLGPTYRFVTRFAGTGPVQNGRLAGDLVIHGGNDPFFVYESAFLVLQRLRALGVGEVVGTVRIDGPFLLNWQPDPKADRVGRALRGHEGADAWPAVGNGERLERVALRVDGGHPTGSGSETLLVTHRSAPLMHVLKACNGYSNNVFHFAADTIGGAKVVETHCRDVVPAAMREEITLDNGAGAGKTNRLSPRAAVAILRALDARTRALGHTITDVLPVSSVDPGTLAERLLDRPRYVVGKTGTFGSVGACALVGLLRSPRYGVVAFAVLNAGVPVPEARAKQDAFVRALIEAVAAEPWPYETPTRPVYTLAIVE
jgi:serine-type D-Ala-D-Ala carboxypeptidase/endopeptidase (penicillin-binding protein 4)